MVKEAVGIIDKEGKYLLDLQFLASRMINILDPCQPVQLGEYERTTIYGKALAFIDTAIKGKEWKGQVSSWRDSRTYSIFRDAFILSKEKRGVKTEEDFGAVLENFRKDIARLNEGESVGPERLEELKGFFTTLYDVAMARIPPVPTDVVKIVGFEREQ